MAFPETQRVVYEQNLLEEVKCQIRFPPILTIDAAPPANFQEAVRRDFPLYELKTPVKMPSGVPAGITQIIERDISLVSGKTYNFVSEDRVHSISLTKDGISIHCRRYDRWEAFRGHVNHALSALTQIYRPSFFTHTCVRYKNAIRRETLGLSGTPWAELLQPWVSGALAQPEVANDVDALQSRCMIKIAEDDSRVEAIFALGTHQPSKQQAFIVESHIYNDSRKDLADVLPRLDSLHRQAGLFFRWCITDKLHRSMRPTPV